MTTHSRFFIIRPDGTTSTVDGEQLTTMRQSGFIGPDDKVIHIPSNKHLHDKPKISVHESFRVAPLPPIKTLMETKPFEPALDDIDTAPLEFQSMRPETNTAAKTASESFLGLEDMEIDQAFSTATSRNLYQLQAQRAGENVALVGNDSSDEHKKLLDGRPLYNIRFRDGRIIGPFDSQSIWERFSQNNLTGSEEFALAGSENFSPFLTKVEFRAAIKIFQDSQNLAPSATTFRIGSASIAPLLLSLSHQLVTGWLFVKNGNQTKLLSLSVGRLLNIRSNRAILEPIEEELKSLFLWDTGFAWFENDPSAAADEAVIREDVLSLCRNMTTVESGFSLSRMLKVLGEQNRMLQLKNASAWPAPKEQFLPTEQEVMERAEQGKTIHATLHELFASGASEEMSVHATFMLFAAGCISFISEKATQEIRDLANKLYSNQYLSLLQIKTTSSEEEVRHQLDLLRDRILEAAKFLPARDSLKQELRERLAHVEEILLDPVDRYVALRIWELGESLENNPDLAKTLKKEYLEQAVAEAISQKRYLEILPKAEHFYQLCPDNIEALSNVLLARFFSATTNADRTHVVNHLKKSLKRFPNEPVLLLAAGSIFIHEQDFSRAQKTLLELKKQLPEDSRVLSLEQEMDALRSTPKIQQSGSASQWVSIVFASAITLAMTALLWMLAVDLELGKTETLAQKVDDFIWVRATILAFFAGIGYTVLHRQGATEFFNRLNYRITLTWLLVIVALGMASGAILEIHRFSGLHLSAWSALGLCLSVFFDRIYFSAFLGHDLLQSIKNRVAAVLLISSLNTLYYLSFYEILASSSEQLPSRLLAIGVGLSVPLTLVQLFTNSVTAPFLLQALVMLSTFFIAYFDAKGWLLHSL